MNQTSKTEDLQPKTEAPFQNYGYYYLGTGTPAINLELFHAEVKDTPISAPESTSLHRLPAPNLTITMPSALESLTRRDINPGKPTHEIKNDVDILQQALADANRQLQLTMQRLEDVDNETQDNSRPRSESQHDDLEQVQVLTEAIEQLNLEATKTLQQLAESESNCETLEQELKHSEHKTTEKPKQPSNETSATVNEKSDNTEQIQILSETVDHLNLEATKTLQQLAEAESNCETLEQELIQSEKKADDQAHVSLTESAQLEAEQSDTSVDIQIMAETVERLNMEATKTLHHLGEAESQCHALEQKLQEASDQASRKSATDATIQKLLEFRKQQVADSEELIQELRQRLQEQDKPKATGPLKSGKNDSQTELSDLQKRLGAIIKNRESIEAKSNLVWELEKLKKIGSKDAAAVEEQVKQLSESVQLEKSEILALQGDIKNAINSLQNIEEKCHVLEMKNTNLCQNLSELQSE